MMRALRIGICAVVVTALGVALVGSPASARVRRRPPKPPPGNPELTISPTDALSADGTTVQLRLTIRCSGFTPVPIRGSVRQGRTSGGASSGTSYKCNGGAQQVVVPVTAGGGQRYQKGEASASANAKLHSSTPQGTSQSDLNTSTTIQLT
jgi:hypothetical protein